MGRENFTRKVMQFMSLWIFIFFDKRILNTSKGFKNLGVAMKLI